MRLTAREIAAIERAARECFAPRSAVRLFGSRLDDTRRGGDIDLLIEPSAPLAPQELVEARNRFIARLYRELGERQIDVLIVPAGLPDDRPVIQAARRDGRLLARVPG
jgi:predicted nucleotidyltransferase